MNRIKILNARRCVAVFMAMLMMLLSLSYTGNMTDAANSRVQYYIYNAKTGVKTGEYYLDPVSTLNNSRGVIDEDDREVDWTKSGVVKLIDNKIYVGEGSYRGSGFVVSDHVIATAAHCVYDYYRQKTQQLSKVLLFDANGNVTLEATPVQVHIPVKFITSTQNAGNKYKMDSDYALITVKEDLSAYACFDLGMPLASFNSKNATVSASGFPERIKQNDEEIVVNTNNLHTMYTGNGQVLNGNDKFINHNSDTTSGNSGGPLYITESLNERTYYTAIAINIVESPDYNISYRMTTDLIHFYTGNNTNISW